jgi:hypothetical protein
VAILTLKVYADIVNALVPNFPFVGRREYAEIIGFEYAQSTGGGAVAIPTASIAAMQALFLQADQEITVALGNIVLSPGGLILVFDGAPATNPPTVTNASGATALVRGVGFGA